MPDDPNQEIYDAIRKADAAGDGESVKKLAAYLQQSPAATAPLHTFGARKRDGTLVQFQLPENTDDSTVRKRAAAVSGNADYLNPGVVERTTGQAPPKTDHSIGRALAYGALKPADNLATVANKGLHAILGDGVGTLVGAGLGIPSQPDIDADNAAREGNTRTGYQTLGNIAGVAPLGFIPGASTTAAGLMLSGGVGGALLSNASDARGVAGDAGVGAVAGLVGGKIAAPILGAAAKGIGKVGGRALASLAGRTNVTAAPQAVADAVTPDVAAAASAPASAPNTRSTSILLKALAAQPGGVEGSLARVEDGQARGVPLAIMDSGDEARGLASALGRAPGDARTTIRNAVVDRQHGATGPDGAVTTIGQMDRIGDTIRSNLGPTANVRTQSESLMAGAKAAARPLYEKFEANPARTSDELESLLQTPAGRQAIARARTIAANERRDPNKMGFDLDDQGEVVLTKTPSPQTLDYVKRGLDDVVEAHRDKVTGRLVLDEAGRAINGVRAHFVREADRLYPDYAPARQAYAGPAAMNAALRKGSTFGAKDAETLMAETRDLSPAELDQYRLGVRSEMVKQLEARTDGANKVQALIGTPKKRAALAQLFGGEEQFGRFMATLGDEGQAAATYGRVNTGSMTAANLADDGHLGAGLSGVAINAGERAIRGTGLVHNAVSTLADLYRYGAGKAGEAARADLARTISNMDPAELENFKAAARQLETTRLKDLTRTGAISRGAAPAVNAYIPRPTR